MPTADPNQEMQQLQALLERYFEVGAWEADTVVADWLQRFESGWVQSAILEALYQGRYKIISIDQILRFWQRRGQPLRHYNREFESIISGQPLLFASLPLPNDASQSDLPESTELPPGPEPARLSDSSPSQIDSQHNNALPQRTTSGESTASDLVQLPELAESSNSDPVERGLLNLSLQDTSDGGEMPTPWRSLAFRDASSPMSTPGVDLHTIEPFRPVTQAPQKPRTWLGSPVDINNGHPEPIQTFIPETHTSGFEQRLKAVARKPAKP